jgi:mannose/fructose-specific phosphotransferase system component IIA
MSEAVRGVVVAHGGLGQALVHEAERISGQAGVLVAVTNDGGGREEIAQRVSAAVDGKPAVIFVDMPCGSCFFAAMHQARGHDDIRVVTGVNLPMLVDFLHNQTLPPEAGAVRAAEKGSDAIRHP